IRGGAGELRRGGARRTGGADLSGRRAVEARGGHEAFNDLARSGGLGSRGRTNAAVGHGRRAAAAGLSAGVVWIGVDRGSWIVDRRAGESLPPVCFSCEYSVLRVLTAAVSACRTGGRRRRRGRGECSPAR